MKYCNFFTLTVIITFLLLQYNVNSIRGSFSRNIKLLNTNLIAFKERNYDKDSKINEINYFAFFPTLKDIRKWTDEHTRGRRGLLVYILPSLLTQVETLQKAIPFVLDRFIQYIQPLNVLSSVLLLRQSIGLRVIETSLWAGIGFGALWMIFDTYSTGPKWLPCQARNDSHAIIIGLVLFRILFTFFTIILIF